MDLAKLSVEETLSQCSKPTGNIGLEVGKRMNIHHLPLLEWGLPIVLNLIKKENLKVLDVGCGAGLAIKLISEVISNSQIYGIDYSEDMVESAINFNIESVQAGSIKIQDGTVEKLPFADNTFDLITATETIYFWPDLLANIREVHRSLKKNGTFAIINEDYYRNESSLNIHAKAMIDSDKINFLKEDEHIELFKKAGFYNVRKHSIPSKGWIVVQGIK